jgi:hypothetical protein
MSWVHGRLLCKRKSAKAVAKQLGLYAIRTGSTPNLIERDFLRDLDTRASIVHQRFLSEGGTGLPVEDRIAWSQYLVSLLIRTPDMVSSIRERGEQALNGELERDPEEYDFLRKGDDPATLADLIREIWPNLMEDFGVMTMPQLVTSEKLNGVLLKSYWRVIALPPLVSRRFLLGDRPVIYNGTMATNYLISLPISPTRVFFSFNHPGTGVNLANIPPHRLVRNLNSAAAARAIANVFAFDDEESEMVGRHLNPLKPQPTKVGLAALTDYSTVAR